MTHLIPVFQRKEVLFRPFETRASLVSRSEKRRNVIMENTVKEEKYAEKMLAEYSPEEKGNSDYETLKELDKKVNLLPKINAYVMGGIYTLVFGFGMVLCLKAMSFEGLDWLGYVLGSVGILGLVGNFYVFKVFLAHQKKIYGSQIIEVSKKMLG